MLNFNNLKPSPKPLIWIISSIFVKKKKKVAYLFGPLNKYRLDMNLAFWLL